MTEPAGPGGQVRTELAAAWAIAKKDIRIWYLKPNIIVSGMLFPLFMFLAFAVGRPAEPSVLVPGLVAITILFSASSIEPVSIPIERRVKTFDRLLSAPISLHAVVLGESLSGFLYALGIALVPLAAGLVLFHVPIVGLAALAAGLLLTSFCFATMGTLFASYPTESPGDIMSMLNVVRLPLIFISGVFIPIDQLPPRRSGHPAPLAPHVRQRPDPRGVHGRDPLQPARRRGGPRRLHPGLPVHRERAVPAVQRLTCPARGVRTRPRATGGAARRGPSPSASPPAPGRCPGTPW